MFHPRAIILHPKAIFCALSLLFCALVWEEAIFAVSKRCANEGFACICKEKIYVEQKTVKIFLWKGSPRSSKISLPKNFGKIHSIFLMIIFCPKIFKICISTHPNGVYNIYFFSLKSVEHFPRNRTFLIFFSPSITPKKRNLRADIWWNFIPH